MVHGDDVQGLAVFGFLAPYTGEPDFRLELIQRPAKGFQFHLFGKVLVPLLFVHRGNAAHDRVAPLGSHQRGIDVHVELEIADQALRHHVGVAQVVTGIDPDGGHRLVEFAHQVQHHCRVATHAGRGDSATTLIQRPLHHFPGTGIAQGGVHAVKIDFHEGENPHLLSRAANSIESKRQLQITMLYMDILWVQRGLCSPRRGERPVTCALEPEEVRSAA